MRNNFLYREITCQSALHYHKNPMPCNYDINIYRGCSHRCIYCFARYSHKYIESNDFFDEIFVKKNIVQVLKKEFSSSSWKGKVVNLGGVTDSYQSCEKDYRFMPDILDIFIKNKNPMILSTKSALILRDVKKIKELSEVADVRIGVSITSFSDKLAKRLEPGASDMEERFEILKILSDAGINTCILLMPIIPEITDSEENLAGIFDKAKEYGVKNIICGTLNLKGENHRMFLDKVDTLFPEFSENLRKLYFKSAYCNKVYGNDLRKRIFSLRKRFGFDKPLTDLRDRPEQQLELF